MLGKKSSASCCRERASSQGTRYISAAKTRQKMLGPGRTPDASGVDAVSALVCMPCRRQRSLLRGDAGCLSCFAGSVVQVGWPVRKPPC